MANYWLLVAKWDGAQPIAVVMVFTFPPRLQFNFISRSGLLRFGDEKLETIGRKLEKFSTEA